MLKILTKKSLILLFIIIFLFGCNAKKSQDTVYNTGEYSIIEEDGKEYIIISNSDSYNNSNQFADLEFDSVEDFLYKVKNGFSKNELEVISNFTKNDNDKITIIDYDNLYYPNIEGFEVKNFYWSGANYSYLIENDDGVWGYLYINDFERFNDEYNNTYENFYNERTNDIISHEKGDKNNEDIYIYKTSSGVLKFIKYDLQEDNYIKKIGEKYAISLNHNLMECNESIPYRVNIYICEYNCYYELYNLDENFKEIALKAKIVSYNSLDNNNLTDVINCEE